MSLVVNLGEEMLKRVLPDITSHSITEIPYSLKWVGMEEIAIPLKVSLESGEVQDTSAKANVYVSLDTPTAKGIHMSRLHLVLNQLGEKQLGKESIEALLEEMVESQSGIGNKAKIELKFELLLRKKALLSDESGFQTYPISISAELTERGYSNQIELTIPYSSTCPCSASLARQLFANKIEKEFLETSIDKTKLLDWIQSSAGSVATPHSQRSYAYIQLSLGSNQWSNLETLIGELEETIGTPVQTAVKREDEQEFARLNAENLMFCEDAARRIKSKLEQLDNVNDYWFKVEHQESLHAHNAVVVDQKY